MNPILPASTLLTASSLAQTQQTGASETTKTHLGSPEKAKKNLEKLIQKNGDKNMYETDYEYAVFVVSMSKEEALQLGLVPENLKDQLPDSENLTFGVSFLNHAGNLEDGNQIPTLEDAEGETNHHYGEVVVNLILPRDKTYYITQNLLVDGDKALEKGMALGISKTKVDKISLDITERGFKREVKVAVKNNNNEEIGFTHKSFGMPMVMKKEQKFSGAVDIVYESRYQEAKIGFGDVPNVNTYCDEGNTLPEVQNLQNLFKEGKVKFVLTGRAESVWEVLDTAASQAE